jgi:hypothetical protein
VVLGMPAGLSWPATVALAMTVTAASVQAAPRRRRDVGDMTSTLIR